ncbi:TPA: hypothetical protein EYP38_03905 [Candidatus Micrarchaeota archaeon]|nr:hypothetical protein [Candidatus Micrarchaeota archaeon]
MTVRVRRKQVGQGPEGSFSKKEEPKDRVNKGLEDARRLLENGVKCIVTPSECEGVPGHVPAFKVKLKEIPPLRNWESLSMGCTAMGTAGGRPHISNTWPMKASGPASWR